MLLADEPTGNLDRESAESILQLFRELNTRFNKTLVVVTHDPHVAGYASRVLHLDKGDLVEHELDGAGERRMRFAKLILRNVLRGKMRTLLTVLGVGVSIFIFAALLSLDQGVKAHDRQYRRRQCCDGLFALCGMRTVQQAPGALRRQDHCFAACRRQSCRCSFCFPTAGQRRT